MNHLPLPSSRRFFAGLSALVALAGFPLAVHSATPAEEKLHEELRALKTVYENAINNRDLAPLEKLFTPESTGVTVDNQPFKSFAELKAIYDKFYASFPGVIYKVKLNPEMSTIIGDLAIARGTSEESATTENGTFTYTAAFTVVLRRTDNGWKLVRSHLGMDPFRNSIVEFFIGKAKRGYGGGALAVGLLAGLMLGWFVGKRKSAAA